MDIKLDDTLLKSVVSEAIMQSLDLHKREALVKGAIESLLTPQDTRGYYGTKVSPIQEAFQSACRHVAENICREMMANNDDVKQKITAMITDAMVVVFETNRDATIQRIATALEAGMAYKER